MSKSCPLPFYQYQCPISDYHIKYTELNKLFYEFKIILPKFQRKFCWKLNQFQQLWKDINNNATNSSHQHPFGRMIFAPLPNSNDEDMKNILCLDGQQRITTTMLIICSIRDFCFNALEESKNTIIDTADDSAELRSILNDCNSILFCNHEEYQKLHSSKKSNDEVFDESFPSCIRFVPTLLDQEFFRRILLLNGPLLLKHLGIDPNLSSQYFAKIFFDNSIQHASNTAANRTNFLRSVLNFVLENLHVVTVMLNKYKDSQILFQWIQEKALAADIILYNKNPGIKFNAIDLLRNVLLSYFMHSDSLQMDFYHHYWIPFEKLFPLSNQAKCMDDCLTSFLSSENMKLTIIQCPIPSIKTPHSANLFMTYLHYIDDLMPDRKHNSDEVSTKIDDKDNEIMKAEDEAIKTEVVKSLLEKLYSFQLLRSNR